MHVHTLKMSVTFPVYVFTYLHTYLHILQLNMSFPQFPYAGMAEPSVFKLPTFVKGKGSYVCVCVCIDIHIYIYIYIYISSVFKLPKFVYSYVPECNVAVASSSKVHLYSRVCMYICVHTYECIVFVASSSKMHLNVYIYIYTYIYIYIYIHTHTDTYIHTYECLCMCVTLMTR
jgi:hypothetical protein